MKQIYIATNKQNGTTCEPQEFPAWHDYKDEARAAMDAMSPEVLMALERSASMTLPELERAYAMASRFGDAEVCEIYLKEIDRRAERVNNGQFGVGA